MATKKDFTQVAHAVFLRATGEVETPAQSKKQQSGRKGGLIGGEARAAKLSPEQRTEIAKRAAQKRWGNKSTAPGVDAQEPSRRKAKVAV